jgi:hypothetical protein
MVDKCLGSSLGILDVADEINCLLVRAHVPEL